MKHLKQLSAAKRLILALLAALFFTLLSSVILHDFGNISISDVTLKTSNGNQVVARIYKPNTATSNNPAPAVIFTHGLTVNKESYAQYGLELARRGFVAILPDMLNHGSSENSAPEIFLGPAAASDAYGSFAAVRYAGTLDYIDRSQIGVAGHSAGGQAANNCVLLDDAEGSNLISAVYLIASEPAYTDADGNPSNFYGSRDMGLYYTMYDHVYFNQGVGSEGQTLNVQQYLSSENAKKLFTFGEAEVIPGHIYTKSINGQQVTRRVTAAKQIHTTPQGDPHAVAALCDFFQDVFQAPNYILGYNNRFAALTISNLLGMLSLLVSCVFFLGWLTQLPVFSTLKAGENAALQSAPNRKGKIWFWSLTAFNCLFAFLSISGIFILGFGYCAAPLFPQQPSNIYALWALLNGIFMLITSFVSYRLYGRSTGATMESWGLKISISNLLKSILAVLLVCGFFFGWVWVANNIFFVDYHYYFWGFKNFPLHNLGVFLAYLPAYLLFGIAVSIALNSAYHSHIGKEPEWANDLFFAVMNMIPALLITLIGFGLFIKTGTKPFVFGSTYTYTYTINAIPVFPIAVVLIRRLFKQCNNPYIPGMIAGILLCWLQISCSFTLFASMYYGPAAAFLP